ncbi:MAG: hypothetical protein J0H74_15665 [Chitinophagaceae bacterium]|nr:hypothetical protein [Chitinophagaceae bacterium]
MSFEKFTSYIDEKVKNRFKVVDDDPLIKEINDLAPDLLPEKQVLRFCRLQEHPEGISHLKTLLSVRIPRERLKDALAWAALSKDMLLNPETADLYLFITWKDENTPSLDECLRIESSEDFCRKFVLRPNEKEETFIERTFISELTIVTPVDLGQDPLISAFSGLEEQFSWFTEEEKRKWLQAFNSGISSYELFYALIDQNPRYDEAS